MDIIIEKISVLGVIKSKRTVKLPKGKLLITIGEKKIMLTNPTATGKGEQLKLDLKDG